MVGHPQYWAQYWGCPTIWTAGGKTFLNCVEHLVRHLLAFPEPNYLSNSQSYVFMKFTSHQASKISQNQSMLRIPPYVCRRGKNHFDPGGTHDFVPPPQISWYYVVISQNYSNFMLISPYFPLTPPRGLNLLDFHIRHLISG